MLAGLKARAKQHLAIHIQAASHSLHSLYRRPWGSLSMLLVMAMVLSLPMLFWVFSNNLTELTHDWQQAGRISLYLKVSLTDAEESDLLKELATMEGVATVAYKNKKQALSDLLEQDGMRDMMHYLPDNPLPSVIDVLPVKAFNTPEKTTALYQRLKALPAVDQAKIDLEWLGRLHAILNFSNHLAKILSAFLVFSMVFVISNTLRLAMQNREDEIQVLKLIGASDAYIRRPFLYLGIWYGIFAAIVAVLFVNLLTLSLAPIYQGIISLYHRNDALSGLTLKQAYCMVFGAAFLGWLAARMSIATLKAHPGTSRFI